MRSSREQPKRARIDQKAAKPVCGSRSGAWGMSEMPSRSANASRYRKAIARLCRTCV